MCKYSIADLHAEMVAVPAMKLGASQRVHFQSQRTPKPALEASRLLLQLAGQAVAARRMELKSALTRWQQRAMEDRGKAAAVRVLQDTLPPINVLRAMLRWMWTRVMLQQRRAVSRWQEQQMAKAILSWQEAAAEKIVLATGMETPDKNDVIEAGQPVDGAHQHREHKEEGQIAQQRAKVPHTRLDESNLTLPESSATPLGDTTPPKPRHILQRAPEQKWAHRPRVVRRLQMGGVAGSRQEQRAQRGVLAAFRRRAPFDARRAALRGAWPEAAPRHLVSEDSTGGQKHRIISMGLLLLATLALRAAGCSWTAVWIVASAILHRAMEPNLARMLERAVMLQSVASAFWPSAAAMLHLQSPPAAAPPRADLRILELPAMWRGVVAAVWPGIFASSSGSTSTARHPHVTARVDTSVFAEQHLPAVWQRIMSTLWIPRQQLAILPRPRPGTAFRRNGFAV